jgi:D-xylose transport system substrate-binding protein
MNRSRVIVFGLAWVCILAATFLVTSLAASSVASITITGTFVWALLGFGVLAGFFFGGVTRLMMRLMLGADFIDHDSARELASELTDAKSGNLATPWSDLSLIVKGELKVIPMKDVHARLVGVLAEADIMSSQLDRLAHEIMDQAGKLAQGADDQRSSVAASTASVGRIDSSLRNVVASIGDLSELGENVSSSTYQTIASIEEVGHNAETLGQAVNEAASAIQEMVSNIHTVAGSADSLSGAAVQTRKSMDEIDRTTRSIRDRADKTAQLSEAARQGAGLSKELIAKTVQGIRILSETMDSTRQVMHQLGIQSTAIGEILTVISSIANETHLLSLNASIMAAKAGEHGRGFSVVAQQIKTLAGRTAESAKEIENLIVETQESVNRAIHAIEEGSTRVNDGMRVSEEADRSLAEVLSQAEVAAQNAHGIAQDTDAQAAMSEQVFKAVDEVAKGAEMIRVAMREQEQASEFLRGRAVRMQELMVQVSVAMSEQSEASHRIFSAMGRLTGSIQSIKTATEDQAASSAGIVRAIDTIRKKADLMAISAQNVSNTSLSVLHQSLLLRHELKGLTLPAAAAAYTIGVLFDNLREERWQREKQIFTNRIQELGHVIEARVAEGNPERQMSQALELIQLRVDLLIIVAVDAAAAAAIVRRAKEARIPVIVYDRLVKNVVFDLFVSFDADRIGELQARTALEKARGPKFLVLAGSPKDMNAQILHRGQMKTLKPAVDQRTIQIVDDLWVPDWSPEQAYRLTRQAIESRGPLDAIIASNDGIAGGAARAVREAMPGQSVVLTGMDTELSACRRIVEGAQTMTVYIPIKLQASRATEAALLLLKGEEIQGITDMIDNGAGRIPSILLRPIKVDAENLEEVVVKDGFHRKEDIFG